MSGDLVAAAGIAGLGVLFYKMVEWNSVANTRAKGIGFDVHNLVPTCMTKIQQIMPANVAAMAAYNQALSDSIVQYGVDTGADVAPWTPEAQTAWNSAPIAWHIPTVPNQDGSQTNTFANYGLFDTFTCQTYNDAVTNDVLRVDLVADAKLTGPANTAGSVGTTANNWVGGASLTQGIIPALFQSWTAPGATVPAWYAGQDAAEDKLSSTYKS